MYDLYKRHYDKEGRSLNPSTEKVTKSISVQKWCQKNLKCKGCKNKKFKCFEKREVKVPIPTSEYSYVYKNRT